MLDGDGQSVKAALENRASRLSQSVQVLCLPGNQPPEVWAWTLLQQEPDRYAVFFGLDAAALVSKLRTLDDIYNNASDKPTAIAKNKLFTLVEECSKSLVTLFRHLAKTEAEQNSGSIFEILTQLEDAVGTWRTARA